MATEQPTTAADVEAAARNLAGRIVRTPLVHAPALGPDIHVKAELLQRGGPSRCAACSTPWTRWAPRRAKRA